MNDDQMDYADAQPAATSGDAGRVDFALRVLAALRGSEPVALAFRRTVTRIERPLDDSAIR